MTPQCRDCLAEGITTLRPIRGGGRCTTHYRAHKQAQTKRTHAAYVEKTYGLIAAEDEYGQLYTLQGGKCFICRRATGATRRLAVDHDHESGKVRGLLCKPCNRMLGHARDSVEFFRRAADYLESPPAARAGLDRKPKGAP